MLEKLAKYSPVESERRVVEMTICPVSFFPSVSYMGSQLSGRARKKLYSRPFKSPLLHPYFMRKCVCVYVLLITPPRRRYYMRHEVRSSDAEFIPATSYERPTASARTGYACYATTHESSPWPRYWRRDSSARPSVVDIPNSEKAAGDTQVGENMYENGGERQHVMLCSQRSFRHCKNDGGAAFSPEVVRPSRALL